MNAINLDSRDLKIYKILSYTKNFVAIMLYRIEKNAIQISRNFYK